MFGMGFDSEGRSLLQWVPLSDSGIFAEKWKSALNEIEAKLDSLPYRVLLVDKLHQNLLEKDRWQEGIFSTKGDPDRALASFAFEQVVQLRGIQKALRRLHPHLETLRMHPLLHPYEVERSAGNAVAVLTHHRQGEVTGLMGQAEERWSEVIERVDDMCCSAVSYTEPNFPKLYHVVQDMVVHGKTVLDIAQIISHIVRVNLECFVLLEQAAPLYNESDIVGGPCYTEEEFAGGMGTVTSMFTHEFALSSRSRYSSRSAFVLPRLKKFNPTFYFWCVILLSSFVAGCQLSGTPISGLSACTGPETGLVYPLEVYHVNGTICQPDLLEMVFEVLDPIDAAHFNCDNLSDRYLAYLATWNSTWVCGGNSSLPPTAPVSPTTISEGPYTGWSTAFQASTGSQYGLPRVCPPKFGPMVGAQESTWPFLGRTSFRHCGGFSRSPNSRSNVTGGRTIYNSGSPYYGMKVWYTNPCGLGYGSSCVEDQDFASDYSWKTPGCFDGWSTESACQAGSGANCYQVSGPTSYEVNDVNYNPSPKWCPQTPVSTDPVVCFAGQGGEVDPECLSGFTSGMMVNGSDAFCLNNPCNTASACWCAYTIGREVAHCASRLATRTTIKLVRQQTLDVTRTVIRSVASPSQMFLMWTQPRLKVAFVTSGARSIVVSKSGQTYLFECHGVSCEYEMPVSFYSESSYCYVSSMLNGSLESTAQVWVEAAKWCKQYLSIWRVYPDWECLSDSQKAFSVLVLILVAALIVIAIPPLLTAVLATARMAWACMCLTTRSMRTSPVSVTVQNYFRGAYRSILPTILIASLAMACQSGPSIGVSTPVCTSSQGVSSCTSQFSGEVQFSYPGQSYCWMLGGSDVGFELQYIYSKKIATTTFLYHTSDWATVTESRFRCNQASCDSALCKSTDEKKEVNPNGQLSNIDVISHSGPSGCFTVDESVQASLEHLCSGLNPNCLYWKSSIVPRGQDLSCYRVSSIRTIPVFNLTITTDSGTSIQTIELSSAQTIGNVTLESSLPVFDNKILPSGSCLVRGQASDYLSVCSRVGFPVSGMLGDIQSNFNLANDSTSPVVYDPAIFQSVEVHSKDVTVSVVPSPVPALISTGKKLPVASLDSAWWMKDDVLQGIYSGKTTFTLFVSASSFEYTRYVEEPCPEILSVSCDGCYSCEAGATIRVTAKSTCVSGVAKIVLKGINDVESSIRLTQEPSEKDVSFSSGQSNPDVSVCVGSVCQSVTCRLSEVMRLNDTKEMLVTDSSSGDPAESPSRWLEDIFNGIGSWWQWILIVAIVIGCIILVVMVSPMVISTMLSHMRRQKVDKKVVEVYEKPDRSPMTAIRNMNYRYGARKARPGV